MDACATVIESPARVFVGQRERWRDEGVLGWGGMGLVRRVTGLRTGRRGALKLLAPAEPNATRARFPERFEREIEIMAQLSGRDPGFARLLDRSDAQEPFYVAELIDGEDLEALLESGCREAALLEIGARLAATLAVAHAERIVHRDVKPSNVRLARGEGGTRRVVLLDFGLAKSELVGPALTEPLVFLGTPRYSSPEAATGLTGPEGDVYSLALVLLEGLTGFRPADGAAHVLAMREQGDQYDVLAEVDVSAIASDIRAVLARALCVDRAARPTAAALAAELRELASRRSIAGTALASLPPHPPKPHFRRRVARAGRRAAIALLGAVGLAAALSAWLVTKRIAAPQSALHAEPQLAVHVARPGSSPAEAGGDRTDGARLTSTPRCAGLCASAPSVGYDATGEAAVDVETPSPDRAPRLEDVESPAFSYATTLAAADAQLPECETLDPDCAPACEQYETQMLRGLPTTAVEACALKAYCNALAQCEPSRAFGLRCERAAAEQCHALRAPTRRFPGS